MFSVNIFGGIAPVVSPRKLDPKLAQKAVNVSLTNGDLVPLKSPLKIDDNLLEKSGVKKTIYRFGSEFGQDKYWFHWLNDVDVVKSVIANDTEERTYFTGDGAPKYTRASLALTGSGREYPYASYLLKVIKPDLTATTVSVANRVILSITFSGTEATVTTEIPHQLQTGSTVPISGASEDVYNGDKEITQVVSPTQFKYQLSNTPNANASGTLGFNFGSIPESRVYAVTYVNEQGAEGAPEILSGILDVVPGQTVSFTGLPTAPTGNYNYIKKRIYRSSDGSRGTSLSFVGEVAIAETDFVDDVLYPQESIPSLEYATPPDDLHSLIAFSNGMMVGVSGNQVCFSVGYKPHAFPIKGRYSFVDKPVGIGSFGQTVVVLTQGAPSLLSGASYEAMTQDKSEFGQPCLSKQSILEIAGGVMWASDEGLAFIGNNGFDLATKARFTRKEWSHYNPTSIRAYRWESRYVGFYDDGNQQAGFVFDTINGDFYDLNFYATAGYTDPKNGNLYLAIGDDVYLFDANTNLTMVWKSKEFTSPSPINLAYGKVVADGYPMIFNLYVEGSIKFTKNVMSDKPFSMPAGYKADEFSFEVVGNHAVKGVAVAQSMSELRGTVE